MTITVEATYENGVLKPARPLPLKEQEKVRVTVVRETSLARPDLRPDGLERRRGDFRPDPR